MPSSAPPRALLIVTPPSPETLDANQLLFEPPLSPDAAAPLAAAFLRDTARGVLALPGRARIAVAIAPDRGANLPSVTLPGLAAFPETGNPDDAPPVNRMEQGFRAGYDTVCVIGSDTPHLPTAFVQEAFGRLAQHPGSVVLGPAEDEGCYLVGAAAAVGSAPSALFEGLAWGISAVLRTAVERAVAREVSVTLLPPWYRVNTPRSLLRLRRDLERGVAVAPETEILLREAKSAAKANERID